MREERVAAVVLCVLGLVTAALALWLMLAPKSECSPHEFLQLVRRRASCTPITWVATGYIGNTERRDVLNKILRSAKINVSWDFGTPREVLGSTNDGLEAHWETMKNILMRYSQEPGDPDDWIVILEDDAVPVGRAKDAARNTSAILCNVNDAVGMVALGSSTRSEFKRHDFTYKEWAVHEGDTFGSQAIAYRRWMAKRCADLLRAPRDHVKRDFIRTHYPHYNSGAFDIFTCAVQIAFPHETRIVRWTRTLNGVDAGSSRTDGLWLQAKQYDDDFTAWNPQPTSPPARWSVLHLERATDRERSLRSIERESGQSINRISPYGTDDALVAENASQDAEINLARASHNITYTKSLLDFAQSDGPPDEWFVLCEDDLLPHPSITSKEAIETANTMLKHLNRSPFEVIQFGGATEPDDSARDAHPIDDQTKPFVNFCAAAVAERLYHRSQNAVRNAMHCVQAQFCAETSAVHDERSDAHRRGGRPCAAQVDSQDNAWIPTHGGHRPHIDRVHCQTQDPCIVCDGTIPTIDHKWSVCARNRHVRQLAELTQCNDAWSSFECALFTCNPPDGRLTFSRHQL